jgi:hypothetical protein
MDFALSIQRDSLYCKRSVNLIRPPTETGTSMFKKVTHDILESFRLIYHQTTGYSNPIIETVLYKKTGGIMYYWGDLIDGNYFIAHRSGFSHVNLNPFDENADAALFQELDTFIKSNPEIPEYLLFYHTPQNLLRYWMDQQKKHFKTRRRRRYQLDNTQFMKLDRALYAIPPNHQLRSLQECPWEDLEVFGMALDSKFYDSRDHFLQEAFGFVLYNEEARPVSLANSMCLVGRSSECDLKTLPEFRSKGYGFITITNYVRESIVRKIDVGWDCFVDNHTNQWIQQYGYTHIIREYDLVSFVK